MRLSTFMWSGLFLIGLLTPCKAQFPNLSGSLSKKLAEQEKSGSPGDYGMLVHDKAVQSELMIRPSQIEKLNQLFESFSIQDGEKTRQEYMREFESGLAEVLGSEQMKRCIQLRIQNAGSAALIREDVASKLDLSEAQLDELVTLREKALAESFNAGLFSGFRPGTTGAEEGADAAKALRKQRSLEAGLTILSQTQREQFKKLCGEPFKFSD